MEGKYIIVEIIPEALSPKDGSLVQISALKFNGFKLLDRFDYRLDEDKIQVKDLLKIIDYDKDLFMYAKDDKKIYKEFKKWCEDIKILYIDNQYTKNYLAYLKNEKESVFKYLGMEYNDDIIETIIKKYDIAPTNYVVDILFEAILKERK